MKTKYDLELKTDYSVDQALLDNNFKIVVLDFFSNFNVFQINHKLLFFGWNKRNLINVRIFIIDSSKLREFNLIHEIKNSPTLIFFFNNRKIYIDSGSGDTNKIVKFSSTFKKFKNLCSLLIKNCEKGKNYLKT
jgi:hypothetical protein